MEFYTTIDRASSNMYGRIVNDAGDVIWTMESYCSPILSGSAEQRLRNSIAANAADWCKSVGISPIIVDGIPYGIARNA